MRRLFRIFFLFVLFFPALAREVRSQSLRLNSATLRFNANKTDQFQLSGQFSGLALGRATAIRFELGVFSQTIPLDRFSRSGDVLSYDADVSQPGLTTLTLDLGTGKLAAKGSNLILSGLHNPVPVRLSAGSAEGCSMLRLQEDSAALWKFSGGSDLQFGCRLSDVPQADPTGFFVGEPTNVRVQARIFPGPLDPGSVQLFGVDSTLNPVGAALCSLNDSGDLASGDDIAGDGVYSCFAPFEEAAPRSIRLIVRATAAGAVLLSPSFSLDAVTPLTEEAATVAVTAQGNADEIWNQKLALFGDTLQARVEASAAIRTLPGVQDAGISSDNTTIWIKYASGLSGGLMLNPPGTRGSDKPTPLGVRTSRAPVPQEDLPPAFFSSRRIVTTAPLGATSSVENNRVLVWDAYNHQFAPADEGPDLQQLFQGSLCPLFQVTYLQDSQATVDSVASFTQYGTVILVTHGAVDGSGQVVFLTDEQIGLFSILSHALDLVLGRVTLMGDVFAIRPSFVSHLPGAFASALIYNGSCESSANNTMANAFLGKGAKTYFGFTRIVNSSFAQNVANQLFNRLVTQLDATGDAFTPVTPKVDPAAPFATFTMSGDAGTAYSGELRNGNFEKGDLTGWTRSGDGRVLVSLGSFAPTEGSFMGIVSTGLGFTTSSGSIEQSFCLPKSSTQLLFDWNFSSEEFQEWCGPQFPFDDPFEVELVTGSGTHTLFRETIDTLCNQVAPTSLAFDQSGGACVPTPGVGLGTGGNDCKVWSTGWRSQAVDISVLATENDGKGAVLRFKSFDLGDSIFDSAVLLDQVKVEHP